MQDRLSGKGITEPPSEGQRYRSIHGDPPPASLVIAAAGYSDVVRVSRIDYAAWWSGYDTEECIEDAMDDGYIEVYRFSPYGDRRYDTYRLTAKGRRAADGHMCDVLKESAIAAKRDQEEREEMRRSGRGGFAPSQ